MRFVSIAAGVSLAILFSAPGIAREPAAAPRPAPTLTKKKPAHPAARPSWEECYGMSRTRGFDHDIDEWFQSIDDCMAGKIPL